MENSTGDLSVISKAEAVQNSKLLKSSLSFASSVLPDTIEAEDDHRSGMESSTPTTSSVLPEIPHAEDVQDSETKASDVNKPEGYQLKVKMCCVKCEEIVCENIHEISGVVSVRANRPERKVVIFAMSGGLDANKVLKEVRIVDKKAKFLALDAERQEPKGNYKRRAKKFNKDNPFIMDLLKDYPDRGTYLLKDVLEVLSKLKEELRVGLAKDVWERKSGTPKFLESNDTTGAQQKVEELFYLLEAIEFWINYRLPEEQPDDEPQSVKDAKKHIHRIELYYQLFMHALRDKSKLSSVSIEEEKKRKEHLASSDSMIEANPLPGYEATEFMVFLINKVQAETGIMTAKWVVQTKDMSNFKILIAKCVHMYERENLAVCIYHVLGEEFEKAENLFKDIIKYMKPSDITNRGRVYNDALCTSEVLASVSSFLLNGHLSQRFSVPRHEVLRRFGMEHDRISKVHGFFVDLFLTDDELMQRKEQLTFAWMQEHDYLYLIACLWKCYDIHKLDSFKLCKNDSDSTDGSVVGTWTKVRPYVEYALHSGASSVVGSDILKKLVEVWPKLDFNAPCKGVTVLHVAAYRGHEEVVKYLLQLHVDKLDINVRTGQQVEVVSMYGGVTMQNLNRWNMPTYQTALHIAAAQGHAKVVKLLCRTPHLHRQVMRYHEEDDGKRTVLDIIYDNLKEAEKIPSPNYASLKEIEKTLLSLEDVQKEIDRLCCDRQVHVDAANTILVGAALIAGITFAGWLQPPLGLAQYYDFPTPPPAPSGTYDSYIGVEGHVGIQVFAIFNSLSFFFAIATVIVGADAALPLGRYTYIGHVVQAMEPLIRRAIMFLIISLLCVLGAFGSAAVVILPPHVYFRKHLVLTILIGSCVCCFAVWQLLTRHSEVIRYLNQRVVAMISKYTNIF